MEIGYTLSSEEFGPNELVKQAQKAEQTGFSFAVVSDHYHPWVDQQGHSPFVWGVLGGIAQVTERLQIGTGVTCPLIRMHPAIVAQAAATATCMLPGRFFLGVGSGENLNEHVLGDHWPPPNVRLDMLEEAISVIRDLWEGGTQTHVGDYYFVDQARVYTLPEAPPPIMVAAGGPVAARLAGKAGDGLIGTSPKADLVEEFHQQGGTGKPKYGQLTVCWHEDEAEAKRMARTHWPNAALPSPLMPELKLPEHYEAAVAFMSDDDAASAVLSGPDPDRYVAAIHQYANAGFDHIYLHQVGPDQDGFFRFYKNQVLPRLS